MGRTPQEDMRIQRRRTQAANLLEKGLTQVAIAQKLGVSQPTIAADLKVIKRDMRESQSRDLNKAVEKEIEALDAVEREAWAGWLRSQEPIETTRLVQKNGEKRIDKTVRKSPGDPRFLRMVLQAREKRCKLLGLDEMARTTFQTPDEEAIRIEANRIFWDFWHVMIDPAKPKPEVIDEEFIEQYIDDKMKSRKKCNSRSNLG
jgi:hypothetical protein